MFFFVARNSCIHFCPLSLWYSTIQDMHSITSLASLHAHTVKAVELQQALRKRRVAAEGAWHGDSEVLSVCVYRAYGFLVFVGDNVHGYLHIVAGHIKSTGNISAD